MLLAWIKVLALASLSWGKVPSGLPLRDVVIRDEAKGQELYRAGPYTGDNIEPAVSRVASEIETLGLATFLRRRQVETATLGPVQSLDQHPLYDFIALSARIYLRGLTSRRRRSDRD
jgi:hypothetical protein